MSDRDLRQRLQSLENLIHKERDLAIRLKVDDLKALQDEKGMLLKGFAEHVSQCSGELKEYASHLRHENRRNARLLATTLTFLRQTMQNCCREVTPVLYGKLGTRIQSRSTGMLHVGRI